MAVTGALQGLRVVDTASLYAGPFISTVLADHGADVVKVEPPGGDDYRRVTSRMWPLLARRKKSVVADVRDAEGAERVRALAAEADVIVVNMPQGLLERLGLDHGSLHRLNDELIYVHVTGFGPDGPYSDQPGNGTLGEALAGLTHMTGDPEGTPMFASVPVGDAMTGYVGAFGVLAACYQRLNGGPGGQRIDVNPVDAMLQVTGPVLAAHVPDQPAPGRLSGGLAQAAVRGAFETADHRWVATSASTPRHLRDMAELCAPEEGDPVGDDTERVRVWIGRRSRDEVIDAFVERRLPIVPVHDAQGVLDDPHLRARGSIAAAETVEWGRVATPAPTPRISGGWSADDVRTPTVGEHDAFDSQAIWTHGRGASLRVGGP